LSWLRAIQVLVHCTSTNMHTIASTTNMHTIASTLLVIVYSIVIVIVIIPIIELRLSLDVKKHSYSYLMYQYLIRIDCCPFKIYMLDFKCQPIFEDFSTIIGCNRPSFVLLFCCFNSTQGYDVLLWKCLFRSGPKIT
jgi:hypothetical protein